MLRQNNQLASKYVELFQEKISDIGTENSNGGMLDQSQHTMLSSKWNFLRNIDAFISAYLGIHGAGGLFPSTQRYATMGIGQHVVRNQRAEDGSLATK